MARQKQQVRWPDAMYACMVQFRVIKEGPLFIK
jgi:hypothetical protein